jgi:hypothetical protein
METDEFFPDVLKTGLTCARAMDSPATHVTFPASQSIEARAAPG